MGRPSFGCHECDGCRNRGRCGHRLAPRVQALLRTYQSLRSKVLKEHIKAESKSAKQAKELKTVKRAQNQKSVLQGLNNLTMEEKVSVLGQGISALEEEASQLKAKRSTTTSTSTKLENEQ
eukprot:TRINITY_DN11220_c1_g1_i1.p2 TRINITY_DN11220_c1_g1~~TRINITY_DN11220_c1_g1_i1.p2  ORF type:complete len:121 (-),score=21.42 TRINITY_DN11220_c1_g1_i1:22-384(-)